MRIHLPRILPQPRQVNRNCDLKQPHQELAGDLKAQEGSFCHKGESDARQTISLARANDRVSAIVDGQPGKHGVRRRQTRPNGAVDSGAEGVEVSAITTFDARNVKAPPRFQVTGETNQWAPLLYDGLTQVELPKDPHHFMTDMTNQAIHWMRYQKSLTPDKPFWTNVLESLQRGGGDK